MPEELEKQLQSLRDALSSKDALIKKYEEERKNLLIKLKKALEDEKRTYERLADLDITRHAEIADLKHEISRLTAENEKMIASELESIRKIDRLTAENEKLKAAAIENVRAVERLKRDAEVKKLQLNESEDERAGLAGRLSALNGEIERLRAEKAGEMERQTAGLKEASEKTAEMLERLETGIASSLERLDELYQRQTQPALTPVVVREGRPRRKSRSLGWTTPVLIAVAVIAMAGLSWYALTLILPEYRPVKLYEAFKDRLAAKEEPPQTNPLPPPPLPAQPSWTGTREVAHEGFTFTLTYLTPDLMEDYGIPAKAGPDALARNFFYVLEVKAGKGCIPEGLINNPRSAVSFIGETGNLLRPEEIPALDESKKAVYKVDACEGKLGAVLFRYFMALPRAEGIQGAAVEGLIGNLIIIK